MKKRIVISAVNLIEAGPLTILKECLEYLSENLADRYEVIALVNDSRCFNYRNIKFYSFPWAKKTWLARLFYEYIYFFNFSKKLNPHLWLSLHDITPNVRADIRAVYCHNPSPFYSLSLKDLYLGEYKFTLFNLFYRYLYAINILKNNFIIVQQDAIRKKFQQLFGVKRVIVAHPTISSKIKINPSPIDTHIFLYPAFPRVFKNFEVICKAAEILLKQGINDFQVVLTISGNENRYSRYIYNSFKHVRNIKFLGIQPREKIFELYNNVTCIIFPSRLETWGVPIIEAKLFLKPILLADLEYARETIGSYDKVKFFNPDNAGQLADAMKDFIDKTIVFDKTTPSVIPAPFVQNWEELFDIILCEKYTNFATD
ncbi:MAG: glycosyltransferase [Candidatus Omnitrophica bacterium]|nr:glycosyltransferase [Candidatus Omnitrophota bacterium]